MIGERDPPYSPEAYEAYRKARSYGEQGRPDQAFNCLLHLAGIAPSCPRAFYALGKCCHTLGRYDEAVGHYEKAIKLQPAHARAWFRKGLALKKAGRYSEALKCISRSVLLTYGR